MSSKEAPSTPKALTSRDRDYLASVMALTTEFRQLATEWKACITQGVVALKSARTSVIRAIADLTVVVDQLQDITTRMSKTRLKVVAMIQRASPPGVMGIDAILKTQEEARQTAILEQQKQEDSGSDPDTDNSDPDTDNSDHDDQRSTQSTLATATSVPSTTYGYIPPPTLIYHIIPGTQATPLAMSTYIQHVFDQALDEMALKEGILEALETIAELKDSGEDELPPLLDQQLTNMVLLWELEPYLDTAPERSEVEATLGVVSWQMEKVK